MKKIYKTIVAVLLICTTLCINVFAATSSSAIEYDCRSGNTVVHVTENRSAQIVTYEGSYENITIVCTYYNYNGTVNLTIYKDGIIIQNKTILNPDYYPEAYAYDSANPNVSVQNTNTIYEGEEDWFGFAYYMNTSSARLDVYWRLWDPNPDVSPSKKYFFAEYGTTNHQNATDFMDLVIDMKTQENKLAATLAIETIIIIKESLSLASAIALGSLAAIEVAINVATAGRNIAVEEVHSSAVIYHTATMADSKYLDVVEEIIEYKNSLAS